MHLEISKPGKNGMGEKSITLVEMFTIIMHHNAVSKEGLEFGRYLHLLNIPDPVKKANFLKNEKIVKQELQIMHTDCIGSST